MIVAERKNPTFISNFKTNEKYERFGEKMPDGRLTEPSDGKHYRLREAIFMSKKLGRPLTNEEMKIFEL